MACVDISCDIDNRQLQLNPFLNSYYYVLYIANSVSSQYTVLLFAPNGHDLISAHSLLGTASIVLHLNNTSL